MTTTTTTAAWTEDTAIDAALDLCRGSYQRDIITGHQRWSGADLRGEARKWGARYRASRDAIAARMTAAGIPWRIETRKRGLLVLVLGSED